MENNNLININDLRTFLDKYDEAAEDVTTAEDVATAKDKETDFETALSTAKNYLNPCLFCKNHSCYEYMNDWETSREEVCDEYNSYMQYNKKRIEPLSKETENLCGILGGMKDLLRKGPEELYYSEVQTLLIIGNLLKQAEESIDTIANLTKKNYESLEKQDDHIG